MKPNENEQAIKILAEYLLANKNFNITNKEFSEKFAEFLHNNEEIQLRIQQFQMTYCLENI